jgi:hypothetical protein
MAKPQPPVYRHALAQKTHNKIDDWESETKTFFMHYYFGINPEHPIEAKLSTLQYMNIPYITE